jgi:hypothetical protein
VHPGIQPYSFPHIEFFRVCVVLVAVLVAVAQGLLPLVLLVWGAGSCLIFCTKN